MSFLTHPISVFAPMTRSVAIAALLNATFLAAPLTAARAESAAIAPVQLAETTIQKDADVTNDQAETIEQRIVSLHRALKITPDEDALWNDVAKTMRSNATAMETLSMKETDKAQQGMTAVQDLKAYEKFAREHVDGLKNLIASFGSLYDAMPDPQKKVADHVFQSFGREGAPSRG